ncbi:MAG: hypothetical protein WB626_05030 [Bacteroidota bacterium]
MPADLERSFKARIKRDNQQFAIKSIYLPNPVFSESPRICVVAMEPAVRQSQVDGLPHDKKKQSFMNFLATVQDFILHYCLYLRCGKSFEYYITDISKGAMTLRDARKKRDERYKGWIPLLRRELSAFGNPPLVSFGSRPLSILRQEYGSEHVEYLMHHSLNNAWRFRRVYGGHPHRPRPPHLGRAIRDFSYDLLQMLPYSQQLRESVFSLKFDDVLKPWHQGMFFYYADRLEEFKL